MSNNLYERKSSEIIHDLLPATSNQPFHFMNRRPMVDQFINKIAFKDIRSRNTRVMRPKPENATDNSKSIRCLRQAH